MKTRPCDIQYFCSTPCSASTVKQVTNHWKPSWPLQIKTHALYVAVARPKTSCFRCWSIAQTARVKTACAGYTSPFAFTKLYIHNMDNFNTKSAAEELSPDWMKSPRGVWPSHGQPYKMQPIGAQETHVGANRVRFDWTASLLRSRETSIRCTNDPTINSFAAQIWIALCE